MTLRKKTLINIFFISVLLVSLICVASRLILITNLSILEQDYCLKNVQRALNVYSNDNAGLLSTARDYAAWDDTYDYARGKDPNFFESNIIPETMTGLQLNYFIFLDNSGQIIGSYGYDLVTDRPLTITAEMKDMLAEEPVATKLRNDQKDGFVAIFNLSEGPLQFAAFPILTSKKEGPKQGSLIVGRYINDQYASKLSTATQSTIQITPYIESQINQELRTASSVSGSDNSLFIKEVDEDYIAGYALLNDVHGKPAIMIKTTMERDIYKHGYSIILFYIFVVVSGCLFFSLAVTFALNRFVISRISELNGFVKNIRLDVQTHDRIPVDGKDEISSLSMGINEMLESMETYDSELRKSRDELEKRIDERTSELSRVNFELKHEIKERELSEKALIETYNENNQILSSISSIIIGVNSSHNVTQWNDVAANLFGLTTNEVMGRDFFQLPIPWDWEKIIHETDICCEKREKIRMDDLILEKTGEENRILGITLTPLYLQEGEEPGFLLVGSDITERRQLENSLNESRKMEAIGLMAAGIAHEINTPTQLVGSNLRYIGKQLDDVLSLIDQVNELNRDVKMGCATREKAVALEKSADAAHIDFFRKEAPRAISDSLEGIDRISRIVSAMRYYSHPGSATREPANINQIIQNALSLSRNEWKSVAEIKTDLAEDLPAILCLPSELGQVFLNLIVNAAHAIRDVCKENPSFKGLITISSRSLDGSLEIRVTDTGTGIPEAIRNKIFDPFFTTKDVGIGTGQGLAICYTVIVKKHGGTLDFETEVGRGTTFIIRLPENEK